MKQIQITINVGPHEDGSVWMDVDPGTARFDHLTFPDERAAEQALQRLLAAFTKQLHHEEQVTR